MWNGTYAVHALVMAAAALLVYTSRIVSSEQPEVVREKPMTIAASCVGRFQQGYSWYLSVNSAGDAQLTVETHPEPTYRKFRLSEEQMKAFGSVLLDERFSDLKTHYGSQDVIDASKCVVTVIQGQTATTVTLHYLTPSIEEHTSDDVKRALRVMTAIRDWFEHDEAADLRGHHKRIIATPP